MAPFTMNIWIVKENSIFVSIILGFTGLRIFQFKKSNETYKLNLLPDLIHEALYYNWW